MELEIIEIKDRDSILIQNLLEVWESSVKATHLFLSKEEINNIKKYVPLAIKEVPVLVIAKNVDKNITGFMRTKDKMLEMLFISDKYR